MHGFYLRIARKFFPIFLGRGSCRSFCPTPSPTPTVIRVSRAKASYQTSPYRYVYSQCNGAWRWQSIWRWHDLFAMLSCVSTSLLNSSSCLLLNRVSTASAVLRSVYLTSKHRRSRGGQGEAIVPPRCPKNIFLKLRQISLFFSLEPCPRAAYSGHSWARSAHPPRLERS